ncbi:MAG: RnfH family protein [Gammaproteobacteria bacterium]|nr:RnfH family protein [Gammaproteobacteria bacterium]MCP5423926.1 RnfH family protein [Gammaproteobacteria bacterium]MCP5459405.1 RnfH family protein [Gammaproteobacteria bacterium]
MQVSVAYSEDGQQVWLFVEMPDGGTVREAIELSGVLDRFPHINLKKQKVGVYGKFIKLDAALSDGDRVEIYRPITVDPKTVPQRKIGGGDDDDDDDGDDDDDD